MYRCVRICNTHTTHNRRENIIFHESNPLTTFCNMTSRLSGHYIEPFLFVVPHFEMRFPLARLVKAEIVSPYCGILINTGVGNPTVPSIRPLGNKRVLRRVGVLDIRCLYKEIRVHPFPPTPSIFPPIHFRAPAPKFSSFPPQESTPAMSEA